MVSIQKLFKAKLCSIDFKLCMIPKTVRSQKMPYVILKYKTKYLAQKEVRQEKSSNDSEEKNIWEEGEDWILLQL